MHCICRYQLRTISYICAKLTNTMNVLLLGSGGREHALAWKIVQSPMLNRLFIAPGNAGTGTVGTNLSLDMLDFGQIKKTVLEKKIDLVIPGPEEPLVRGIYDYFHSDKELSSVAILGPSALAANLEGSKDFAKKFMTKYDIPTARYNTFTKETVDDGIRFLHSLSPPYVLKADGLAAGKGVVIEQTLTAAVAGFKEMLLTEKFGLAAKKVVIEEFLSGIELSVFILTDAKNYILLPEAKDYKRVGEGDTGLNTGGMGAVSPVPFATPDFMKKVKEQIIEPTMHGLRKEGMDYKGFIFFGLINCNGDPKVIEYNVRMGDPETEVVMPRIKSDILPLLLATAKGELRAEPIETDKRHAITVMLVSGGYPEKYAKGKIISGLNNVQGSIALHASTAEDGKNVLTNGGRVLAVTSLADNLQEAIDLSYTNLNKIDFEDKYYRRDIGKDVL